MLYLGTLGVGVVGSEDTSDTPSSVDILCKVTFVLEGMSLFYSCAWEKIGKGWSPELFEGVMWVGVGAVSAAVGVPTLELARIRAREGWRRKGRKIGCESDQFFKQYVVCMLPMSILTIWRVSVTLREDGRRDEGEVEAETRLGLRSISLLLFYRG